ncbi:hypothetical protein [Paracoccus sp. SSJ]|uniref:hypothetical protein n=1 Tax=Paracoccus sp. SSJ TaxID=3050636 RepID=UPI00254DCFDD|nr:hypothetical protein [Paracoccus sp. SSJ]MDK8874425.1 hypothetical protein [Paracoccus sp. SSJ]
MSDDLIERLRDFTEEDAYAMPWTFGAVVREAADELARLRAEVERLKWERDVWREKMDLALKCERDARAALSDERAHADALAGAAYGLDSHAVAIHDADGKRYSVRAMDYARLFDTLAQHKKRRKIT